MNVYTAFKRNIATLIGQDISFSNPQFTIVLCGVHIDVLEAQYVYCLITMICDIFLEKLTRFHIEFRGCDWFDHGGCSTVDRTGLGEYHWLKWNVGFNIKPVLEAQKKHVPAVAWELGYTVLKFSID
jgi:hypothetical protein